MKQIFDNRRLTIVAGKSGVSEGKIFVDCFVFYHLGDKLYTMPVQFEFPSTPDVNGWSMDWPYVKEDDKLIS